MVLADLTITRPGLSSGLSHLEDNMKLQPINLEDLFEDFYTDYCMDCDDEGVIPLRKSEWMNLREVRQSIKNIHSLFGKIRKEQS